MGRELRTIKAAEGAGAEHDDLHGARSVSRPAATARWALVGDDFARLRFHERLEVVHLRQGRLGFVVAPQLFQNVGEHKILARLIRLARNGAPLRGDGSIKVILTEIKERDEIERLNGAKIEP